eukprot:4654505-Alexandrium_andersonii.AAC.1
MEMLRHMPSHGPVSTTPMVSAWLDACTPLSCQFPSGAVPVVGGMHTHAHTLLSKSLRWWVHSG